MSMGFTRHVSILEEDESCTPTLLKKDEDVKIGSPWSDSSDNSLYFSSRSSSTQSWVDDYEISATKELQDQYDKFEAALYSEGSLSDLSKALQDEVKIWAEHSPHIRVRGVKANLNQRPDNLPKEEKFDSNYEEVFASHGTLEDSLEKSLAFSKDVKEVIQLCDTNDQQIIKDDLKNAIVGKLFEQAWPKVLEKFEPVIKSLSAGKQKEANESSNKSETFLDSAEEQRNRKSAARSNSSRSHVPRKPFVDSSTEHLSVLSSRGLRNKYSEPPESFRSINFSSNGIEPVRSRNITLQARKGKGLSSLSAKNPDKRKAVIQEPAKVITLPPIEALAITPRTPDKRSVSAMVRFNKTLPRVPSNTSKSKGIKSQGKCGDHFQRNGIISQRNKNESLTLDLQVIGTRSATTNKSNKWRY